MRKSENAPPHDWNWVLNGEEPQAEIREPQKARPT